MIRPDYILGIEVLDTHQKKKRTRILAVAKLIKKNKVVKTDSFIAILEFNGIRKKVAKEYIDALLTLKWIKSDGVKLTWIKDQN